MLPFFEVSHLPSSASFYSAVLQPLGLYYISAGSDTGEPLRPSPPPSSDSPPLDPLTVAKSSGLVTYGKSSPTRPIFQLREARQPKKSRITLSALSPSAVTDFRSLALRADPSIHPLQQSSNATTPVINGGETRTRITDFDGNTMDVVYLPPSDQTAPQSGSAIEVRRAQSIDDETSRVLDWNYDVAASEFDRALYSPAQVVGSVYSGRSEPYTVLRRSVTTSTIEQAPRELDNDSNATTLVGALLGAAAGAAAGAALTYSMMRSERERAPRQDFDPPQVSRRSTFPDRFPAAPAAGGRYVEVERTVEKIRYPDEYAPMAVYRPPPQYLAKYSQPSMPPPRTRAMDDMYDDTVRSRHAPRQIGRASSVRTRSEAPDAPRAPLMIMDHEHRSNAGSRHSIAKPPTLRTQSFDIDQGHERRSVAASRHSTARPASVRTRSHEVGYTTSTDTYVTAPSRRSSVVRPPHPTVETELAYRSKAPSKAPSVRYSSAREPTIISVREQSVRAPSVREPTVLSTRQLSAHGPQDQIPSRAASKAASRIGGASAAMMAGANGLVNSVPPNASRTPTHISARNVTLPPSAVGSSHAAWDDDNVSVAPSDSISCVGSKMSRRRYNS